MSTRRKWRVVARRIYGDLTFKSLAVMGSVWFSAATLVWIMERDAERGNIKTLGDALWWGIVTFLTVGYGDLYPTTIAGRVVAGFLMLTGVAVVGVQTARVSSYFLEQSLREGRGVVDSNKLRDHFVICGVKDEMQQVIAHILDFNKGEISGSDIVLVAPLTEAAIASYKATPGLEELSFVAGDFTNETFLKRAAPERARKVMILADRSPNANGTLPSVTEVDAKTIMAAMTLNSIAKGTEVVAEILDPKMDRYLKLAGVSEIIYSREYSRLMLSNVSVGTGIANVVFDLLDPKTPARIRTLPLPSEHPATFSALKVALEKEQPWLQVIGVLENSGNQHWMKENALRAAQRTPDVKKLLQNLMAVKELRYNNPIFNPSENHPIHEGSMAIVIEVRDHVAAHPKSEDYAA